MMNSYIFEKSLNRRENMNTEKIDSRYRLLHLIYEGKTSGILTDSSLRGSLNDLMKYELVTIYNNKLRLTERGKTALKNGINSVITTVRTKSRTREIVEPESNQLIELVVTITVLLIIILLFMLF